MNYDERMRKAFDLEAIYSVYVGGGLLTADEFGKLLEDTIAIRDTMPELSWTLFDHILSVHRNIGLVSHYEALSAGLGRPFVGIEEFYRHVIDRELLPARVLNKTIFYRPLKGGDKRIGELMVGCGVLTPASLERSLGMKVEIAQRTGVQAALGQILCRIGPVSTVDMFQVLGLQLGIQFESLDASAPKIFGLAIKRAA